MSYIFFMLLILISSIPLSLFSHLQPHHHPFIFLHFLFFHWVYEFMFMLTHLLCQILIKVLISLTPLILLILPLIVNIFASFDILLMFLHLLFPFFVLDKLPELYHVFSVLQPLWSFLPFFVLFALSKGFITVDTRNVICEFTCTVLFTLQFVFLHVVYPLIGHERF